MNTKKKLTAKKAALLALFAAVSLIIFTIESTVPPIVPIPGVKLGLANTVTLFLVLTADKRSAFAVLIVRTVLAAVFAGQAVSFVYSIMGGILALLAMCIANRILNGSPIWFISAVGGIFHNIGQTAAACMLLSPASLAYLPHLLISGCITGALTGILTDLVITKMKRSGIYETIENTFSKKERKDKNE